jgi:short-subunit dehydrogenase
MSTMQLSGRVAAITGAGSGIGRALAQVLAARGCRLALADIHAAGLADTVATLPASAAASSHVFDVAERDAAAAWPAAVLAAHGRVDLLVNNAGVALGGTFEMVSEADFDWLMQINFHAPVRLTRAFLPHLRASDDARLVNISSVFGLIAPAEQTAYCASKFALRGFSNALRHELEGSTVGVTVVHPGGVATQIARNARVPAGVAAAEVARRREWTETKLRMPPLRAAEIIVRAVEQRRARVLVGLDAQVAALLERLAPVGYWRLLASMIKAP